MHTRTRKFMTASVAGLLAVTTLAACDNDDDGVEVDDDVEQDVEDGVDEVEDEVEDGVDELDEEIDDETDG